MPGNFWNTANREGGRKGRRERGREGARERWCEGEGKEGEERRRKRQGGSADGGCSCNTKLSFDKFFT